MHPHVYSKYDSLDQFAHNEDLQLRIPFEQYRGCNKASCLFKKSYFLVKDAILRIQLLRNVEHADLDFDIYIWARILLTVLTKCMSTP